MKLSKKKFHFFFLLGIVFTFSLGYQELQTELGNKVGEIFKNNCSVQGCHAGMYPAQGLNLEEDRYPEFLINISSQELPSLKLVDTENPQKSYLLMKIKGDKTIKGVRMPANSPPLKDEDIETIEDWIQSLKEVESKKEAVPEQKKIKKPVFWGTRIINLPTPRTIGKGRLLFRISHRFFPSVDEGYDVFYGLDGPASIFLSLGYGLTDNFSLTLGRANVSKEVEFSFRWTLLEHSMQSKLPLFLALQSGVNLVTLSVPEKSTLRTENLRFHAQLSAGYRVNDSLSLLIVPGYCTNTHPSEDSFQGTLSLGIGARYMIFDDFSFILEWIPVISGYKAAYSGWGAGLEKKIGGHVFQVFVLNTIGIASAQYIPGGDFSLKNGDFRLGFNIFRWF